MLRVCNTFNEEELKKLAKYFTLNDIKKAYLKAKGGIGNNIGKISDGVLLRKVYLTSNNSAGRLLFLFFVSKNIFIPIIVRLKDDKLIGNNLSMNNKKFVTLLNKNFDYIESDLIDGNYIDYYI